jgi:hypothetical protein
MTDKTSPLAAPAVGRPAIVAKKPPVRRRPHDPARQGRGPHLTPHPLAKPSLKGHP